MKTVFEEGDNTEQQPLPGEIIGAFQEAHHALVEGAFAAYRWPSVSTLGIFDDRVQYASVNVGSFFEREFFRDADTDIPVQVALDAVADATVVLVRVTKMLHPAWLAEADYSESFREEVKTQLLGTEEDAIETSAKLCNSYMMIAANLGAALYDTPEVMDFLEGQAKHTEHKEQAIKLGLIAAAAFVGATLAQRRRK